MNGSHPHPILPLHSIPPNAFTTNVTDSFPPLSFPPSLFPPFSLSFLISGTGLAVLMHIPFVGLNVVYAAVAAVDLFVPHGLLAVTLLRPLLVAVKGTWMIQVRVCAMDYQLPP